MAISMRGRVYVLAPVVHQGKVWIYYEGGNWRGPEALYRKGKEALHAAGLATLAEDAFVSVDAGKLLPGELVTHFFSFEGNELSLHMKAAWNNAGAGQPEPEGGDIGFGPGNRLPGSPWLSQIR